MNVRAVRALALVLTLSLSLTSLAGASPLPQRRPFGFGKPEGSGSVEPGLHLLSADETGVVLELYTPDFQVEPGQAGGAACERLTVPGYAASDEAGWPQLPVHGAMVGVPPQAALSLTVLESESVVAGRYDLCPVPRPILEMDGAGGFRYGGVETVRAPAAYAANAPYPASQVEIVSTDYIRSQRVAQLRFHPFQYNPVTGELQHHRRIRVRLEFGPTADGPRPTAGDRAGVNEGPFEPVLQHSLVNYEAARQWRVRPAPSVRPIAALAGQGQPSYKVLVDEDGIYQVTRADLVAAGVDVGGLDPRTFKLSNQGVEVAIHVAGEGDGSFDPGDYLLFYGQKTNTKYTDVNVYWLTWGGINGRRMTTRDGTPSGAGSVPPAFQRTIHREEDRMYSSRTPWGEDQDHWFWDYILAYGAPASKSFSISLEQIAAIPFTATVRGLLDGYSFFPANPDHHTRVYLNGHLVDDATWDGEVEYTFEAQVPGSYLIEGVNTFTVACPSDLGLAYDAVYVNWFEVDYQRTYTVTNDQLRFGNDAPGTWEYRASGFTTGDVEVFDVTGPADVARIINGVVETGTLRFEDAISTTTEYLALTAAQRLSPVQIVADAPSDLHSTANGADYLIVTHGDFYTDVLPLAAHRAGQGLRTQVVDVQDVYDEFNYGVFDPEAIKDFLAYAYTQWAPPAPVYVLLVGDGTLDFKDRYGSGYRNLIPPYLAAVDPWINETATDNRYVCVSGDDALPDMHVGRLPVNTSAEAATVVGKVLGYEQSPPPGDWNQQVLFVADNADDAGDFAYLSDIIANGYLPAPYTAQKVYYKVTHPTVSGARAAIINAIKEGRLLVNYVGHASYQWWAHENLLHVNDIPSLTNTQRLPFMAPMTCYDGFFHAPGIPSLGESIVRAPGGGAIASWSPTGLGVAMGHDYLNRGLYQAIFFDDVVQLGPATTQGKLYLYSHTGGYRELLDTYLLFGDPALALNVLRADVAMAKTVDPAGAVRPGDSMTYTLTYSNAGPATAHHVVITDVLPAALISPTVTSSGAAITPRPGSRFVWDVADLAAGEGGTITIAAVVSPTFAGILSNTAVIATTAVETNTVNNAAGPVTTHVIAPDLRISKQGPVSVRTGDTITYTLAYSNAGTAPTYQVVITDDLPAGLLSPTVTSMGAAITLRPGSRFVWDVADLAPGAGGRITITAVLSPTYEGPLTNTVTIATATSEATRDNNTATVVTWVQRYRLYLPLVLRSSPAQVYLPVVMRQT